MEYQNKMRREQTEYEKLEWEVVNLLKDIECVKAKKEEIIGNIVNRNIELKRAKRLYENKLKELERKLQYKKTDLQIIKERKEEDIALKV